MLIGGKCINYIYHWKRNRLGMDNDNLLYIEDSNKRKLFYRFTPAALVSNFIPLVVVLDDQAINFEYKMWNVLTPLYTYEKDLLLELIKQIVEEYECEDYIYLCAVQEGNKNIEDFVEQCKKEGINIQLYFCPNLDQDGLKKVLDKLERMTP